MTGNTPRAVKTRAYIDETISSCKPGTIIFSNDLARGLCARLHHGESSCAVGIAMRERSDVVRVSTGVWKKI